MPERLPATNDRGDNDAGARITTADLLVLINGSTVAVGATYLSTGSAAATIAAAALSAFAVTGYSLWRRR
ncbi:hypothetical protein ACNAW0_18905 [Micromonospora sp. SL1-18]|uniref:hypothetical protein n=1 Tax=Micromonospora sp. SL1-18 TaxID=3399128 RepID=UPI003A4DD1AB